ncbi:MAG: efflux RND transporter permease subunit [Pseudomonadota bacterium]
MYFTDIFIKRPVFASVLSLLILLAGAIAYFKMPVRLYPKIDATVITINTTYAGAPAALMEGFVTTPIENSLAGVDGLDYITSNSTLGSSTIKAHFYLGYDINKAVADVINKVSSVRRQLPKDINDPIIHKDDPNSNPVVFIAYTDKNAKAASINDYLIRSVQPVLATLPGVGQARIFGDLTYAMRVWLNPNLMAARHITATDVVDALTSNNIQAPTGRLENKTQEFDTLLDTNLSTPQQFDNIVIKQNGNSLVRIKDIGYAQLGTPEQRIKGYINGVQGNVMGIIPRSDANPLDVATLVKNELKSLQPQFPPGLHAKVVWDNSKFIAQSIKEVKQTIFEAAIFVIIIIFLFLGSLRTVLIPSITIPVSLIGVCALMFAMGYSLNTMTFLAFVLAIGMVVDDAIVVSENIHRNMDLGKNRFQAAIFGAREIRFAVIAMTLTLAAVYAPIIFMGGLTGSLFKEFAFTLAGAVIISGFVSLTLSPMMCSKLLADKTHSGRLESLINRITNQMALIYQAILRSILRSRKFVVLLLPIILVACLFLYYYIPKELAPKEDEGGMLAIMQAPAAANLKYTTKYAMQFDALMKKLPEVSDRILVTGIPDNVNSALEFIKLKPWSERKRDVKQLIDSLYPQLEKIIGLRAFVLNPFSLPGDDSNHGIDFVLKTTGTYSELNKVAQKIKIVAEKNPIFKNVDVDLKIDKPEITAKINRNLAADVGVSMKDLGNAVNIAIGQPEINQFEMKGRSYYVLPQVEPEFRNQPDTLENFYVRSKAGALVPLSSFVTLSEQVVPQTLNHFQQMRAADITADPAPGYTLGQAIDALEKIAKKNMPQDMQYDFAGGARQFIESSDSMLFMFGLAIVFIFLVLAAQFESFRDPLIVLLTVPLSTLGALAVLKLFGGTINIYTNIGIITLIGLISKHGILMVEFANQLQQKGKDAVTAIIEAASIRLRPILMTTAAMILGSLPLAMATGAGSNSRHQIGITIIGGMAIGTLFTLIIIPVMYSFLATMKKAKDDEVVPAAQ